MANDFAANDATDAHDSETCRLVAGPLNVAVAEGRLRLFWSSSEIIRQIDYPLRDAEWRTLEVLETESGVRETSSGFTYRRRFKTLDDSVTGKLSVQAGGDVAGVELLASVELKAERAIDVNRAGFALQHPIKGVVGEPLEVRHSDGYLETIIFPDRISPSQPVFDIAGLRHWVNGIEVAISMEGEVFEMEDQRNWTDASFKTYCRPLAWSHPYRFGAGQTVLQTIRLTLRPTRVGASLRSTSPDDTVATMPHITLAHDPVATNETPPNALTRLAINGLLFRVDGRVPVLPSLPLEAPVTLEIVTGTDARSDIARVAATGLVPRRVVALPREYLASHQPEGPWPQGYTPTDLLPLLRAAFPGAAVGGGMLTNFTEFNRCPPNSNAIDFATFGTTAIVHAADDRSVIETLEALPQVFASARALVPGCDLHLGLVSIGMRSNPYGMDVVSNPHGRRIPMAMADPRQQTDFAAAWAVGAAAAAARCGIASFAPAMTAGPLGLGRDGGLWPIFDAVAALAALAGSEVEITGGPSSGVVRILGRGRYDIAGIAANLGPGSACVDAPRGARIQTGEATTVELPPFGFVVFIETHT